MGNAASQRKRRKKHKKFKRCLWCPRRARKNSLCTHCTTKHRLTRRKAYERKRPPGAKQYTCKVCGEQGHNARRHKL